MSTGSTQPFKVAGTVTFAATTASSNAVLPTAGDAVLVFNASAGIAFVRFGGDNTVAAGITDIPIPAGARMLLYCGLAAVYVAVVLSAGTGAVYVSRGDGTVY